MPVVWDNTTQDTITVATGLVAGPTPAGSKIVVTDHGLHGVPEVDFYSTGGTASLYQDPTTGALNIDGSVDSLTIGPSTTGDTVVITDTGAITGHSEIDLTTPNGRTGVIYQDVNGTMYLASPQYTAQLSLSSNPATGQGDASLYAQRIFLDAPGGVGGNGAPIAMLNGVTDMNGNRYVIGSRGTTGGATSSVGKMTITHGLTSAPVAVVANVMTGSTTVGLICTVSNYTATTFDVVVWQVAPTPGVWAGHSTSISWAATL